MELKITFPPEVVKTLKELAPKLVAMSIGWMARLNIMSVTARAMMKTSVDSSFFLLRVMTTITRRLKRKLTKTAIQHNINQRQLYLGIVISKKGGCLMSIKVCEWFEQLKITYDEKIESYSKIFCWIHKYKKLIFKSSLSGRVSHNWYV